MACDTWLEPLSVIVSIRVVFVNILNIGPWVYHALVPRGYDVLGPVHFLLTMILEGLSITLFHGTARLVQMTTR